MQGVSLNERQRLIPGSPAPAVLRKQQQEKQLQQLTSDRKPSMPNSPKITLSKCKDNDIQRCDIPRFEDTMLEVANITVYLKHKIHDEFIRFYKLRVYAIPYYLSYITFRLPMLVVEMK